MKIKAIFFFFMTMTLFNARVQAQKTWDDIYMFLSSSNCNSSSCHGSGSANPSFNVDTPQAILYSQLINGTPVNPYARDSADNKLIVPGAPERSFMLRKLSHCNTGILALKQPFEGPRMPESNDSSFRIDVEDLELIFNWIAQGASDTAVITPDTVAGDICDLNLFVRTLPAKNISFAVYPNPALDNVTFSYILDRPSPVTAELLDASGKILKVVYSEQQASGAHTKAIALQQEPGIYFVRLTIGTAQYMRKLAVY